MPFDPDAAEKQEGETAESALNGDRWKIGAQPFDPGTKPGREHHLPEVHLPRVKLPKPVRAKDQPQPKPRSQSKAHGLAAPTAKLVGGLVTATAVAALVGSAAGLPLPSVGGGSDVSVGGPVSLAALDSGTPAELSRGPFHPVTIPTGYGEFAASFGGGRGHEGQDVFGKIGTPLVAVRTGVVVDRDTVNGQYSGGRGNYINIYSPLDNRSYDYLHMNKPSPFKVGDAVTAGQVIGQLGCTGSCDGPHLHFEIRTGQAFLRSDTKPIDPMPFLKQWPPAPAAKQAVAAAAAPKRAAAP